MEDLDQLLDEARRRARLRRQLYCTPEQFAETILLARRATEAAKPVTEWLDSQPRLGFEPAIVDLSAGLRQFFDRVRPDARRVPGSDAILTALLADNSPLRAGLRNELNSRLMRRDERVLSDDHDNDRPRPGLPEHIFRTIETREEDSFLVDRSDLVERMLLTLMFGSPVLVGPVGSGRRSLIRLLARRIGQEALPDQLRNLRLLELDPTELMAGTSYRGDLEQRVRDIIDQLVTMPERAVLIIEELATFLETGKSSTGVDPFTAMIPHLRERRISLIGCVSQDQVRETIERRPGLLPLVSLIYLPTIDLEESRKLLAEVPRALRAAFGVTSDDQLVAAAVALTTQHVPHLSQPGAADKLLRGAGATLAFEAELLRKDPTRHTHHYWQQVGAPREIDGAPVLTRRHLLHEVGQQHRIPFEHLDSNLGQKIAGLDEAFRSHIFGQDHVLPVIRNVVKVSLSNLSESDRPRGRLFFVGPPGTGKTECAKLIATYLMGSDSALLRFNMSEYAEASAVSSLLGSDPGLVRSDEGGRLTEPMLVNPHRVILFDEIEKAHPKIWDLFLQILDNGKIEDKKGRSASFRHAICIFTSNAGCDNMQQIVGRSHEDIAAYLQSRVPAFRQEFFDRIEAFVPFLSLDQPARRQICAFHLRRLTQQLTDLYGMSLSYTDEVLAAVSMAPARETGARNILRWIEGTVKPAVVDAVLARAACSKSSMELRTGPDGGIVVEYV